MRRARLGACGRFELGPDASLLFFFLNDTAPTEIYTLSLHDALPIFQRAGLIEKVLADAYGLATLVREGHVRSEEHTSELQSPDHLVCRLLLEKKKYEAVGSALRTSSPMVSAPVDRVDSPVVSHYEHL